MDYSKKAKRLIRKAFKFAIRHPEAGRYFGPIFLGALEGYLFSENTSNRFPLNALEAIYITKYIVKRFWR